MNIKVRDSISDKSVEKGKYAIAKCKRQEHVEAVLNSSSSKNIVVAGPGTGKTYLFKMILEGKEDTLTLSFVNALVEDLSLELCGISDVKTLHGFARGILKKAKKDEDIKIFPELGKKVISVDAKILLEEDIDFDDLFRNRDDDNTHIEFYKKRKDYYEHYGFPDSVFAAVKLLEKYEDKIPNFTQVVVDEFQDFNKLEVSLIDILAKNNPVLLAGDDDQALYGFKGASPEHIRERYSEQSSEYTSFNLPYCSRCTRVIVETINDIIKHAKNKGHLFSRIDKPFQYFNDEDKDKISDKNPCIIYKQLQAKQIPWYIQDQIQKIAEEVRDKFSVLIISPTNTQCKTIVSALKDKGFNNIQFKKKKNATEPTLLDGLKLLLKEKDCNLGWRIVAKNMLNDTEFETLLKQTHKDDAKKVVELIKAETKKEVKGTLTILRAVRDGKQVKEEDLANLLDKVDIDAYGMARGYLENEIKSCQPPSKSTTKANPEVRKIPITATTIQSSKGLAADYVFITHFDDKYFIKDTDNNVSDQDICNFLVALTRARRKAILISSDVQKKPAFLGWIDEKHILKN